MDPDENLPKYIIFFLGAGASVEAHVPDTRTFIYGNEKDEPGFIRWLLDNNKIKEHSLLVKILDSIDEKKREKIDVEYILQILHELNAREQNCVIQFYDQNTFKFKSKKNIQLLIELENNLRQFIRERVTVKKENINYLSPLLAFPKPIKIFSVNYDTCIELLSLAHKLTYTDGFELNWQRDLFKKPFDIKLYKLHGSIIWYSTDRHNYLKLPVIQDEIDIISGEKAKPFILYPMGNKGEFAEPLDALSSEFQENLKNAMICIVVGYTFRDEDIRRIFFEISQKNQSLKVVLISPNAGKIFRDRLKYFDDPMHTPSTLSDKVICWNYTFGAVLKDFYLSRNLQTNIPLLKSIYDLAEQARKNGIDFNRSFKDCIETAILLDDLVTIENILRKELGIKPPDFGPYSSEFGLFFREKERFKILYSLAILHLFNSDERNKEYFDYFIDFLKDIKNHGYEYFELHKKFIIAQGEVERAGTPFPLEQEYLLNERNNIGTDIKLFRDKFPTHLFPFYYWSTLDPNTPHFFEAIKEFWGFIQLRIKLREGNPEYSDLLMNIEKICQKILEIQKSSEKKTDSEAIEIGGRRIEIEKIQNLLKLFDELIIAMGGTP